MHSILACIATILNIAFVDYGMLQLVCDQQVVIPMADDGCYN